MGAMGGIKNHLPTLNILNMSYANISYSMPQDHVAEIQNALNTILSRLPFLVNLTAEERQRVLKFADRDNEFVNDVRFATVNFPDLFPVAFNVEEYQRDVALFDILCDLRLKLESLTEKVKFTDLALGGEVMKATLQGYKFVQTGAQTTPGIQSLAEKMKQRYKNSGKKKPENG
jgi:hypothetical protein